MAGGLPTSAQIARALVVVARQLGDTETLTLCAEAGAWWGGQRSRWIVMAALDAAYPNVGVRRLCGWLGLNSGDYAVRLAIKRNAPWWSDTLVVIALQLVAD